MTAVTAALRAARISVPLRAARISAVPTARAGFRHVTPAPCAPGE
jgi:hypothetical protein